MKKYIIIGCLVVVILGVGGFYGTKVIKERQTQENLVRGIDCFQQGTYEDAVLAFDKVLAVKDKDNEAIIGKAAALIALGKSEEAVEIFAEIKAQGRLVETEVYINYAGSLVEKGEILSALQLLNNGHQATNSSDIKRIEDEIKSKISLQANTASVLYCRQAANFRLVFSDDSHEINLAANWSANPQPHKISMNSDNSVDFVSIEPGNFTLTASITSLDVSTNISVVHASSGNVVNGALADYAGGWIYYKYPKGIKKMRLDGSNRQKVGNLETVLIEGKWMFSSFPISRMSLNGTNYAVLRDEYANDLSVVDGWLYFGLSQGSKTDKLYRMRDDGGDIELLTDEYCHNIGYADGWLYYAGASQDFYSSSDGMYRIRLDGTGREKISEDGAIIMQVVDQWVYYSFGDLKKVNINGTGEELLLPCVQTFNIVDNWIYYCDSDEGGIFRIKTDGSDRQKLSSDINIFKLCVVEGWVFFNKFEQNSGGEYLQNYYYMRTDGSEREKIE